MNEFYVTNRDVIKNLALNTGTTGSPVFTNLCTASEITLNTEFEEKDWYVYCDAIQRSIITGVSMSLEGTIKLDIKYEITNDNINTTIITITNCS